jgi:hypothetical protein
MLEAAWDVLPEKTRKCVVAVKEGSELGTVPLGEERVFTVAEALVWSEFRF